MVDNPFYKSHWVTIEGDRLSRYQNLFKWNPASSVLYETAKIKSGHTVAEFGCGPGHTAIEIANWVGSEGHVHALDINTEFIAQARKNTARAGVDDRITVHQCDGSDLPLPDGSLDRVTARNTLIYVDDPMVTLEEFKRVLRPGGKVHAIEGDWPMMVVEPVATETWRKFIVAAAYACRTPDIGRKLPSLLARSGFRNIDLQVITRPDMEGRFLPMITDMAGYAQKSGKMGDKEIDDVLFTLDQALADRTYLILAPQFVVSGSL